MSEIIEQQIKGLTERLSQLKATERIMLQASGLEMQAAAARKEAENIQVEIGKYKDSLEANSSKLGELTGVALSSFLFSMDEALPEGHAYIRIGDKSVAIGWTIDGIERPIQALSGGERVAFDIALAHALGAGVLIKEVAELDPNRLELTMARLQVLQPQVILVTAHPPKTVDPTLWTVCATS